MLMSSRPHTFSPHPEPAHPQPLPAPGAPVSLAAGLALPRPAQGLAARVGLLLVPPGKRIREAAQAWLEEHYALDAVDVVEYWPDDLTASALHDLVRDVPTLAAAPMLEVIAVAGPAEHGPAFAARRLAAEVPARNVEGLVVDARGRVVPLD